MSVGAGFQSATEEQAAFEAFVDATEDDFQNPGRRNDDNETRQTPSNPAQQNENTDADELETGDDVDEERVEADDELGDDELDPDADQVDGEKSESTTDDGEPITSFDALGEHFGVPAEDVLANLMVDDYDGGQLSVGDALDSWREGEGELAERQETMDAETTQIRETGQATINSQATQLMELASTMHKVLLADFNPEALAAVEAEDPRRFAELIQRKVLMEGLIRQSITAGDEIGKQRQGESVEEAEKVKATESKRLLRRRPEWRNTKQREAAMKRIQNYLIKVARFKPVEIANITDHRIMLILDDAVAGRKVRAGGAKKAVEKLLGKNLKSPSTGLKRSTRRDQGNPRNQARANSMAKLRQSGRAEDAVSLLMEHIED